MMKSIPEDNMFYKFAEHVWMEAQKERWRHTTPMLLVTISTEERYRKMDEYINGICFGIRILLEFKLRSRQARKWRALLRL